LLHADLQGKQLQGLSQLHQHTVQRREQTRCGSKMLLLHAKFDCSIIAGRLLYLQTFGRRLHM
jgi:hypothetical protein